MGSTVAAVVLLAFCCASLAEAYPRKSDDALSSMWHVFRQIHESDVARRPYLVARRSSSPMVIEKTKIIPASEPKPPAPSTIITRIKTENPVHEEANTKAPKSALSSVWSLKMSGRMSEAESLQLADVKTERIDSAASEQLTSTSLPPAGKFDQAKTSGKFEAVQAERLSQQSVGTTEENQGSTRGEVIPGQNSHAETIFNDSPEGSGRRTQQTSSLKFWEVFRRRIPDRWSVFNKAAPAVNESLAARSPDEENPLKPENKTPIEQMKEDAVVATSTQLPEPTVQRNESEQLDSSVDEPVKKRLTIRVDNTTFYSATPFVNGSLMFQRTDSADDMKYSQSLDDIEIYYPGIGSMIQNRPPRIVVNWSGIVLSDAAEVGVGETMKKAELSVLPTVTELSGKAEVTSPPTVVELSTDASVINEEIITPADFITEEDAEALTTTMPTSTTDDQLTTPLLKSSEGAVLTHSLTPTTTTMAEPSARSFISVSSSSSSSSSSISTSNGISYISHVSSSYSSSNPGSVSLSTRTSTSTASKGNSTTGVATGSLDLIAPDNSTSIVVSSANNATRSRVIQPARFWSVVSSGNLESSKRRAAEISEILPLGFLKNHSMAPNKPTMAPLLIFMKGSSPIVLAASAESLDQFTTVKPQVRTNNSSVSAETSHRNQSAPLKLKSQSFLFHPKANFSERDVTFKVASHNSSLTSLILAHSAALISGKSPSALSNGTSSDTKPKPSARHMDLASTGSRAATPNVHVIVATALADPPEFEFRDRSLDSSAEDVAGRKYDAYWAVPTQGQLTETPNGYLAGSSPGVSSHVANRSHVVQLPTIPKFTCGQAASLEEFVLTNPNYPDPDEDAGRCEFRLIVTSPTVCQVRVEFKDSRMLLPRHGSCLYQQMSVSGSLAVTPGPKFCGWNSDQHFYLELNEHGTGPRHIDINVHTKAAGYRYSYAIVVKQIDCHSPSELIAPKGCFQYYPSRTGEIKSFNFEGGQYWSEQNYKICIRTSQTACTISMTSANGNFGLNELSRTSRSARKTGACHRDYLVIPGIYRADDESSDERICGTRFADPRDVRSGIIIGPLKSDVYVMEFHAGTFRRYETRHFGPGFAMNYMGLDDCPENVKRRSR